MSRENVKLVYEATDAFNRQDVGAFVATASPDVEWDDAIFWSGVTRTYRGRAELRDWFNQVSEPWQSIHVEVEEIADVDIGCSSICSSTPAAKRAVQRRLDFGSGASCGSLTDRS